MLPDRVSNPGPLTYESGALPIALRGPAIRYAENGWVLNCVYVTKFHYAFKYTGVYCNFVSFITHLCICI